MSKETFHDELLACCRIGQSIRPSSVFRVVEFQDHDYMEIVDLISEEHHLLYSPGIVKMEHNHTSRVKHMRCLLLPNGDCMPTVAMIHFKNLSASEMKLYCSVLDAESFRT